MPREGFKITSHFIQGRYAQKTIDKHDFNTLDGKRVEKVCKEYVFVITINRTLQEWSIGRDSYNLKIMCKHILLHQVTNTRFCRNEALKKLVDVIDKAQVSTSHAPIT